MKKELFVAPKWQSALSHQGFHSFDDYFRLAGSTVHCHETRDILRVRVGHTKGFLKREFFVLWKERLASWWAGCGWVSKSEREWAMLTALQQNGVGVPEPIAAGCRDGRAFILLRELDTAEDLPTALQGERLQDRGQRAILARDLGRAVARLHNNSVTHPDLYGKHVFLEAGSSSPVFLDLQRSRRRKRVSWRQRWRDLAALDASLSEQTVSLPERLVFLRSYVRASQVRKPRRLFHDGLCAISRRTNQLLQRRRIRAMRSASKRPDVPTTIQYHRFRVPEAGYQPTASETLALSTLAEERR